MTDTFTVDELAAVMRKDNWDSSNVERLTRKLRELRQPKPLRFMLELDLPQYTRDVNGLTPDSVAKALEGSIGSELRLYWSARSVTVTPITEA